MFKLAHWKERFETKILALVSLDLDERLKKLRRFEDQGLSCDKNNRAYVPGRKNKIKRKG